VSAPDAVAIDRAARWLAAGGLVALPTETVYGLGADATNPTAVAGIFALKGRPADHPLIVHLPAGSDVRAWATGLPSIAERLMAAFWPGPLTLVLPRPDQIPPIVTGGQDTVAVRCPAHPVAQALLARFAELGSGLVAAPSANRFGHISPTTAAHVRAEFGDAIDTTVQLLDGGPCPVGIESTIVDVTGAEPRVLRPGSIGSDALAAVAGVAVHTATAVMSPRVPGALAAHYAPRTALRLVSTAGLQAAVAAHGRQALAVLAFGPDPGLRGIGWRQAPADPQGYARTLYANLRDLDLVGAAVILVEAPPEGADWLAIRDRLGRAATGSGGEGP
jgi:L-threonylcarbamoyladenylate synthase